MAATNLPKVRIASTQELGSVDAEMRLQELLGTDLSTQDLNVSIGTLLFSILPSYFQTRAETCKDLYEFQTFGNLLLLYIKRLSTCKRAELLVLDRHLLDVWMTLIQILSDALLTDSPFRTFLLDLLLQLSVEANIVPGYLELHGISIVSKHAVFVGGYGDVWQASFSGNLVALKTPRMPINLTKLHRNLCREALLWRQLRHPNILAFLGLCHSNFPYPAIVSPWMQNGTVLSFVQTNRYEIEHLDILIEISEAIAYLHGHSPPIIHQDIRCANILIDEQKHAVLADFGLSRLDSEYFNTFTSSLEHGCVRWQAPELLFPGEEVEYPKPSCASDIWAFGMVMLELFTEKPPFAGTALDTAVVIDIYHGRKPERPRLSEIKGEGFSDRLWECMRSCWKKVPAERLYVVDICTSLKMLKRMYQRRRGPKARKPLVVSNLSNDSDNDSSGGLVFFHSRLSNFVCGARGFLLCEIGKIEELKRSIHVSASDAPFIIGVDKRNALLLETTYNVQITSDIEHDSRHVRIDCTSPNLDSINKALEELQKLVEFQKLFGDESKQINRWNKLSQMASHEAHIAGLVITED